MSDNPELGVCYYPEHWSEDLWITDAKNIQKKVYASKVYVSFCSLSVGEVVKPDLKFVMLFE